MAAGITTVIVDTTTVTMADITTVTAVDIMVNIMAGITNLATRLSRLATADRFQPGSGQLGL